MSLQINLLPVAPKPQKLSARRSVAVAGLSLLLLTLHATWLGIQRDEAVRGADQSRQQLQQQQQLLKALQKRLGDTEREGNIAAQIAALEPQTKVSRELLDALKSGELGSLEGYGAQLTDLASLRSAGVWVTAVRITNAGRNVRVEGRALSKNDVLPYARQLNRVLEKYSVRLEQVEIVPVPQAPDQDGSAAPLIAFRVY
ncbi:MAG: hypothetical protein RL404_468 [Pseudomonadota bacterium]|jgi:Tfp pilus assembly protein PilN